MRRAPAVKQVSSIGRRLVSLMYECVLLAALCFFSMALFQAAAIRVGDAYMISEGLRYVFWVFLFLMLGLYFSWCWLRGGQTLPMKTWKIRLLSANGRPVTSRQVIVRYCFGWVSLIAAGAGFVWAWFDKDQQFLHDRIAGTMIVRVDQFFDHPNDSTTS